MTCGTKKCSKQAAFLPPFKIHFALILMPVHIDYISMYIAIGSDQSVLSKGDFI